MAFNLKSGNTSAFKTMGSSPVKQDDKEKKEVYVQPQDEKDMGLTEKESKEYTKYGGYKEYVKDIDEPNKKETPAKNRQTKSTAVSYKEASAHNALGATESHFGHPHGPKPQSESANKKSPTPAPVKQTKSGRGNIFTKKGRVQRKMNIADKHHKNITAYLDRKDEVDTIISNKSGNIKAAQKIKKKAVKSQKKLASK